MGDLYGVGSGADSEDNNNDNDTAILLSARNIVDLSNNISPGVGWTRPVDRGGHHSDY
jgi:hypothetical protein